MKQQSADYNHTILLGSLETSHDARLTRTFLYSRNNIFHINGK